jgi:hypothetical protein
MKLTKQRIIPFTQVSMAIIYIAFWVLKLVWGSPAEDLVLQSTAFVDFAWFYPVLWSWEVWLWLLFLYLPWFKKFWFWLFVAHMAWTFIPFITTPELCVWVCRDWAFSHPTFTIVWQYIVKNLSLIACWLLLKYNEKQSIFD